jgi:hypothetical protein
LIWRKHIRFFTSPLIQRTRNRKQKRVGYEGHVTFQALAFGPSDVHQVSGHFDSPSASLGEGSFQALLGARVWVNLMKMREWASLIFTK